MKNKRFISIRIKLIFAFASSTAIALLLSTLAIFIYTYNVEKESGIKSLSQITKIMGQNLIATIEFDDKENAEGTLSSLGLDENIEAAFIFKNDMDLFSSYSLYKHKEKKLEKLLQKSYKIKGIQVYSEYIDSNYIIVCSPIFFEDKYLATLCIISNTKKLTGIMIEQFFVLSLVFLTSLIIALFMAFRIQRILTTPIFQMKDAMEIIANKKTYKVHIKSKNNDEFEILFSGFNDMINTIENRTSELEQAKHEVEAIHKQTRDSIEYASHIQQAIVPSDEQFQNYFSSFFTYWKPRDIVGGDIYLFEELRNEDECLLMAIDCTGHGVPGAFVTMLVKAIERQVVSKIINDDSVDVSPAWILSYFNKKMKTLLKQDNADSISNAGFDGGILYFNKKEKIVKYAGAETPLFIVQDDEMRIIKTDRHSVGYKKSDINHEYKEYTIDVSKPTKLYISSDGYLDQKGGNKGFPYGKKRFQQSLKDNSKMSMLDQKEMLIEKMAVYQGDYSTIDDSTIIGMEIKI